MTPSVGVSANGLALTCSFGNLTREQTRDAHALVRCEVAGVSETKVGPQPSKSTPGRSYFVLAFRSAELAAQGAETAMSVLRQWVIDGCLPHDSGAARRAFAGFLRERGAA